MPDWSSLFAAHLDSLFANDSAAAIRERYAWVDDYSARARDILSPASLDSRPPPEIYAALDSLNVPKCQIRMTNLGRMNQAEDVVHAIRELVSKPGDFAVKYKAGKIPQAGVVTLTQILCLVQPHRFAIRNAPFTKALAKQVPFYNARALDELDYESYLDICRELARVMEEKLKPFRLDEWARDHRFLLLYAILVK